MNPKAPFKLERKLNIFSFLYSLIKRLGMEFFIEAICF